MTRSKINQEEDIVLKVSYMIPNLSTATEVMACLETLCGVSLRPDLVKNSLRYIVHW